MALKRKPPAGNVRRVAPIDNNLRYAITSKADETVQCESFQERKLTLLFDRDSTVQEYRSQPERFTWTSSQGTSHTYVPDFIVWKTTGAVRPEPWSALTYPGRACDWSGGGLGTFDTQGGKRVYLSGKEPARKAATQ